MTVVIVCAMAAFTIAGFTAGYWYGTRKQIETIDFASRTINAVSEALTDNQKQEG